MYSFRKSKKGFTLIELMVVVAIIGVLALLGLRVYSGQQAKSRNAVVKANAGSIQTIIQSELADTTPSAVMLKVTPGTLIADAHIFNPFGSGTAGVTHDPSGQQIANGTSTGAPGEVYVTQDTSTLVFSINGVGSDGTTPVYPIDLTAQR